MSGKRKKYLKQWRKANREKHKTQQKLWRLRNRTRVKQTRIAYAEKQRQRIYNAYGNKCVCCGEDNPLFLTVDHKNGNGRRYRKILKVSSGTGYYGWIIRHNFPNNLQLMCFNCNCGRYRNGGICPHKQ